MINVTSRSAGFSCPQKNQKNKKKSTARKSNDPSYTQTMISKLSDIKENFHLLFKKTVSMQIWCSEARTDNLLCVAELAVHLASSLADGKASFDFKVKSSPTLVFYDTAFVSIIAKSLKRSPVEIKQNIKICTGPNNVNKKKTKFCREK